MKAIIGFVLWFALLLVCWPLALGILVFMLLFGVFCK